MGSLLVYAESGPIAAPPYMLLTFMDYTQAANFFFFGQYSGSKLSSSLLAWFHLNVSTIRIILSVEVFSAYVHLIIPMDPTESSV